jgi:LPXTG-motif cell wall-anchored protein
LIKLKVSSSSSFTGDYTLYVKVGEKNFSFLSSQSTNSANSALAAQAMFASDNFYSATIPGENGTLFSISSADSQSVPGTIVGLAGIGILGFLSRKKKKP